MPFEIAICEAADDLRRRGIDEFHGYLIAKEIKADADARLLTAHGTLYRALGRLDTMGLLQSRWEDHAIAARESRPVRRLYTLTAVGDAALVDARRRAADAVRAKRVKRRLAPI